MRKTIIALATTAAVGLAGLTAAPREAHAQWWIAPAVISAGILGLGIGAAVAGGCNYGYGCGYGYYGYAYAPAYAYVPRYAYAPVGYAYAPNVVSARPYRCGRRYDRGCY